MSVQLQKATQENY